jgi:hypothetical protein
MVRTSRGFRPTYVEPAVTADIKTNSGNVCEYWDASCHVQQGMDSINEGIIQAGEDITSWGETTTQWVQGGFVEAGENIQDAYVKNVETPIVQGVENIQDAYVKNVETPIVQGVEYVQGGIDEQIKAAQDAAAILAKNTEDAFNATIKAAQDAADATAKAAADAAAAAGEGATKGMTDTLKIAGVAALGLGVLLVMKK